MGDAAIETHGLTKVFERKRERGMAALWKRGPKETITAVDHVDLAVRRGELFGLLGPNAAGKTTLVKLLATLLLPTEGTARIAGFDVAKESDAVRRTVGVVLGGERALYWRLTARENLWYFSRLYNMPSGAANPRIEELLGIVGLADRADERVENYSKGMKQRLHVARGLLNDPEVLLLDEPTIGLDPRAARSLRALVRRIVEAHGKTVVLTTHYMYEADALSDRVAVMDRGRIIACDRPAELKRRHGGLGAAFRVTVRPGGSAAAVREALAAVPGIQRVVSETSEEAGAFVSFRLLASEAPAAEVAGALAAAVAKADARLVSIARDEPTLEDVFVDLTGKEMVDTGGDGGNEE
ncbi:MAG: ABC transporter ATP-binding protein [Methanobacteriota archaeon]